jgi:ClpP class serine protease
MRRSLQEARRNKDVKAIVLRIDSPGGSALTSDLIWRELELTKSKADSGFYGIMPLRADTIL